MSKKKGIFSILLTLTLVLTSIQWGVLADPLNPTSVDIEKTRWFKEPGQPDKYIPLWTSILSTGEKQALNVVYFRSANGNLVYCLDNGKLPPEKVWTMEPTLREELHDRALLNVIHNGYPNKNGADYGVSDNELEWATSVALYLADGRMYNDNGDFRDTRFTLDSFNRDIKPTYSEDVYSQDELRTLFRLVNSSYINKLFDALKAEQDHTSASARSKVLTIAGDKNLLLSENQKTFLQTMEERMKNKTIDRAEFEVKVLEARNFSLENVLSAYQERLAVENTKANAILNVVKRLLNDPVDASTINQDILIDKTSATYRYDDPKGYTIYGPIKLRVNSPDGVVVNIKTLTGEDVQVVSGNSAIASLSGDDINNTPLFIKARYFENKPNNVKVEFSSPQINANVKYAGGGAADRPESPHKRYQMMYIFGLGYIKTLDIPVTMRPPIEPMWRMSLIKKDAITKAPLEGAEFEVFTSLNILVDTIRTGKDGIARTKPLKAGSYYFKEKTAPTGYALNTQKYSFTANAIIAGGPPMEILNSKQDYPFSLYKVDNKDKPLEGAVFFITDQQERKLFEVTSAANGRTQEFRLAPGNYKFLEMSPPAGYDAASNDYTEFTVRPDGTSTLPAKVVNFKKQVVIRVKKVDADTRAGLSGAEFEVFDKTNNKLVDKFVTTSTGEGSSKILDIGEFYIVESKAPAGYIKNTQRYNVELDERGNMETLIIKNTKVSNKVVISKTEMTTAAPVEGAKIEIRNAQGKLIASGTTDKNGKTPEITVTEGTYTFREILAPEGYVLSDKSFTFTVDKNGKVTGSTTFTNELKKYPVVLEKIDGDTKAGLEGAEFEIRNAQNKVVGIYKTGKNGKTPEFNLPWGSYKFVEKTAPNGYTKSDREYSFAIDKSGKIAGDTVIKNFKNKTTFIIEKVDERGRELEGARFEILNSAGKVVFNGRTNSKGQMQVDGLTEGKYTLKETEAPAGFALAKETFEIRVDASGKASGDLRIKNKEIIVEILKKDRDNGDRLSGAEFEVYNSRDRVVFKGKTNSRGILEIDKLEPGRYTFKEITAPSGYELDNSTYQFRVEEDGKITGDLTVYNKRIDGRTPPPSISIENPPSQFVPTPPPAVVPPQTLEPVPVPERPKEDIVVNELPPELPEEPLKGEPVKTSDATTIPLVAAGLPAAGLLAVFAKVRFGKKKEDE